MSYLTPFEKLKKGRHILAELDGWTLEQKIEFLLYLLDLLQDRFKRGYK